MDDKLDRKADIAEVLGVGKSTGRDRTIRKWIFVAAVILMIAAGIVLWMKKNGNETVKFRTQPARRGDLTVLVNASGNLEPINQVDVGSELSGIIRTVEADFNDRVEKGQVLAKLDTVKLEAKVLQSRANLAAAEAQVLQSRAAVKKAAAAWEKMKKASELSGGEVPSRNDMDQAESAYQEAQAQEQYAAAQVDQVRATLESDEADLKKAFIHSPINGVVLSRNVEPGQTVAASLQAPVLFTLAEDLTQMALHVAVDEADVGQVQEGQEATFTVDAYPDRSFSARITQVRFASNTTDGVVTYETVLNVDNADLSLRPGMTATADITVHKVQDVLLIPNAALRFQPPERKAAASGRGILGMILPRPPGPRSQRDRGQNDNPNRQRVWTLQGGQLFPVAVTIGATDGVMTQVTDGDLSPGTELVVE